MYFGKSFYMCFCLLLIYGFTGCRHQDESLYYLPYETIYDKEPNNSFDTALLLNMTAGLNIAGFYNAYDEKAQSPDLDYYYISLKNSGYAYRMTLTAVPGVDGKLMVFSPNYELLFEMNERGVGEAEVVWDYYCKYPAIYIAVTSCGGANDAVPYMLSITADNHDSRIEVEPNNEKKNASELTPLFPLKAYIVPNDDVDCYHLEFEGRVCDFRVRVESFSNLDISLTVEEYISVSSGNAAGDVEIIRKSCVVNQNGWGSSEVTQYFSSGKSDFYVYVTAKVRSSQKEPVYYITLETFSDGSYEREFNNCREDATPILAQEEIIGELDPGDVDWFYFDVLYSGTKMELSLDGMNDKRFMLDIEELDGTTVYSGKGTTNLSLRDLKTGRYYLILRQDEKVGVKNRYRLFINTYSNH
ncbi:MAG: hypothetical protein J1G30_04340 [Spirochaetales bacterium]|nr:hypothetical protein [Spirochaetales bacterium]